MARKYVVGKEMRDGGPDNAPASWFWPDGLRRGYAHKPTCEWETRVSRNCTCDYYDDRPPDYDWHSPAGPANG